MKRGCTQCGECLDVCPVYALYKREEYSPKGKRLLMEPLDGWGAGETPMSWERIRHLSRLCAGCGRCRRRCARKLSTSDLLAEVRAGNPHWTQHMWDIWIRRAGPLWPTAGRIAAMVPLSLTPGGLRSSLETARALVDKGDAPVWLRLGPRPDASVPETPVTVFAGCTAVNVRPQWTAKAEALLRAWGYRVVDGGGFTCCGGTLHHAGMFKAQAEVRRKNVEHWRSLGTPMVVTFCASCKHSLETYADVAELMDARESALWRQRVRGLSALLTDPDAEITAAAPRQIGYHQPCHWDEKDPDMPLLQQVLPQMRKGKELCCGMGGILKMSDPDVSAAMGRRCLEGFELYCRDIVTGCSGCAMQLASVAPKGTRIRHWLDVVEVK